MEAKLKKKRNGPRLLKKTKQQLAEARRALREEDIAMQKGDTNKKRKREEGEGEKILTEEGEKRRRLRDKIISLRKERQKQQKGEKEEEEESDEYSEIDEEEESSSSSSSSRNKNKTTISRVKEGEIRKLGGLTREKVNKLIKINYKQLKGTKGESDRFIQVKKNRWMLSGKRGLGKTHSR
ncbi:nucleolar GTP-binding protein, putative [Eimeria maxima]|uniref:Nucleolar GTP-binding protein, putative n=1 Tax=Eimeria maxima TaxID=5804 RepID=U6LZS1_EIMMA|nr:nucleolar GTP-binding protein, putative [Eimeria maxima]CDJ56348.1 nucleolar GTP-binding protein, putative [Eimeria maxima]